jgi:DNA-binding response OmpR family regulator
MGSERSEPILVVEADREIAEAIATQLVADGYAVELAGTAEHARMLARERAPRLAVLGRLDSPRGALTLLQEIRDVDAVGTPWEPELPAIVLSDQPQELDMLRAFDAGADDFLARPATYLELRARMRAILRRAANVREHATVLDVGALLIDTSARKASIAGEAVDLRRMEFELLVHLAREPQRVFAKDELLRAVWGYRSGGSTRTVDSHACRLRRKLASHGTPCWVISVWGVGYRLI